MINGKREEIMMKPIIVEAAVFAIVVVLLGAIFK
jgi:hypothetical protein